MSFLNIFNSVMGAVNLATPIISGLNPTAAKIMQAVSLGGNMVEAVGAGVMAGQQKKEAAMNIALEQIQEQLPNIQQMFGTVGVPFTLQQKAAISKVMDASIALNNAVSEALPFFQAPPQAASQTMNMSSAGQLTQANVLKPSFTKS